MKNKKLKWVVEFSVDQSWVADGFDLDNERALEMLSNDLTFAYPHELAAKILKKPDAKLIKKLQGWEK